MKIERIVIRPPGRATSRPLFTGTAPVPGRAALGVDHVSLTRDGERWLGVMGEVHYSRLDPAQWHDAIAKMKAGGIDVIASYVFWIHHEETEGGFDFVGRRDVRRFVETCARFDLPIVMRIGPWCHGEVRNGGLPDWVLDREPRTLSAAFLESVRRLYEQIAIQLRGLLWKDGGPVIGIQLDNEFGGPAEYLLKLKRIAREVGLDVPFYTRTGWPSLSTPMPFGEMLPLFGAYAEGFWDRDLTSMPGSYWKAFCFEALRTDVQIGMDQLGERVASDDADTPQYPYLTCELGGGMEISYHRRLRIEPLDILAIAVAKVGSGSNLPGYYMYHGGVNPQGKTTLHESQATRYWNDVAIKNYDFQAPLGSFGQVRPHYHLLRRLHLFLNEFGGALAAYRAQFPALHVTGKNDLEALRWSIRTDGLRGFLFVNNYQRGVTLSAKRDVQFHIELAGGEVIHIPREPVTIPEAAVFIWPFNLDLGLATLRYATAQVICSATQGAMTTYFFAATSETKSEFAFEVARSVSITGAGTRLESDVIEAEPSLTRAMCELTHHDGRCVRIVLVNEEDSLHLWQFTIDQHTFVIHSDADLHVDAEGRLWVERDGGKPASFTLNLCPAPRQLLQEGKPLAASDGDVFRSFRGDFSECRPSAATSARLIMPAGEPRTISLGFAKVAEAPPDAEFENAAVFAIPIPEGDRSRRMLRVHYVGDVARFVVDGKLILDQFYNGMPFDLSLDLVPSDAREVQLQILPLQKDAPIYLDEAAKPDFAGERAIASVDRVELITRSVRVLDVAG